MAAKNNLGGKEFAERIDALREHADHTITPNQLGQKSTRNQLFKDRLGTKPTQAEILPKATSDFKAFRSGFAGFHKFECLTDGHIPALAIRVTDDP